jgi:hypothetical protein
MQQAAEIVDLFDVLDVERWASEWLGQAWVTAPMSERTPERLFCLEMVGRACSKPSKRGLAAVTALRRVAPESEFILLDEAIALLGESQPAPPWAASPSFEAIKAWRATNIWDSERVLFVEYISSDPAATGHTLMAQVLTVGTTMLAKLGILQAGAASSWVVLHGPDDVPMPLVEAPVAETLADLADCLRTTDMVWPRQDDEDFVDLRALAWARSRTFLPGWPDFEPISDTNRTSLIEAYLAEFADEATAGDVTADDAPGSNAEVAGRRLSSVNDDVLRSLADIFIDFGDAYLRDRPLGWSPDAVSTFLADRLSRKVALDSEQRAALPEALRRWLRFGLRRRGVEQEWIDPVVAAVDDWLPAFLESFDDESSWGPAKQVATELQARGVDLTDKAAVDHAIRALNAENLARRLTEP